MADAIDTLLDGTLDDLADLPSFKHFPAGVHLANIHWTTKTVNKKPSFELKLKGQETVELSEPESEENKPIAAGDETNVLFMMTNNDGSKNEISQGMFKNILKTLGAKFGGKTIGEVLAASEGALCKVVTKIKENKENGQKNTNIVNLEVV